MQQQLLQKACDLLGLNCLVSFPVRLPDGSNIEASVYLPELGGPSGMLVFSDYENIKEATQYLVAQGYGYSVYGIPSEEEGFDLAGYIEMFSDWGWNGPSTEIPDWFMELRDDTEDD